METVWEVGPFVIGYLSMAVLGIRSMKAIDKNLKDRQSRMREAKLF